jgi:hypothetical protein
MGVKARFKVGTGGITTRRHTLAMPLAYTPQNPVKKQLFCILRTVPYRQSRPTDFATQLPLSALGRHLRINVTAPVRAVVFE